MLRGLLKPFIGGGRTEVKKPPSESSKVVVPASERRISSLGRPRHPSAGVAQNTTSVAVARIQIDTGMSSINGTSSSSSSNAPIYVQKHDTVAASSGQSAPNSSSTWARKKDIPRAKHAPLHRRQSAARIMKNPPLVDLTEDATADDGEGHAHASRQRSNSISELRKKAPPPARIVTASEDSSETMTEPSDEGRRPSLAKGPPSSTRIAISSSDDEIYSRKHKRNADGNAAVAIRKSACKVSAQPREERPVTQKKKKKIRRDSEHSVKRISHQVSHAQRLEPKQVSSEQPKAKAGKKRRRTVFDESHEEQELHDAATLKRDTVSMSKAPQENKQLRSSSGKRVRLKSPQRPSVASTGPVRRSTQTLFDLAYDYHAVYKFSLVKIDTDVVESAMKLCCDTLFAWYREARDLLYLIGDSLGKDDASRMRLSRLRDRLAGMWCVCAHVLIEIGERKEGSDDDSVGRAADVLVAARSCPIVGNHPWIILAQTRLHFYGVQSLDDITNATKAALATCNDGLRSSPSLHIRNLLEDTDAAKSRSLDEQNMAAVTMLHDLASMIKACQVEFSSTFLFADGARILLFEVNRLSLMQERLLDRLETTLNPNLHFGLGRFRLFDAVDLPAVTWQTPPDVTPASLVELAVGQMISRKHHAARGNEDMAMSMALTPTDQAHSSPAPRPVSRVADVEYICSGCRQCGFSAHSELQAHESKCSKVQYTCPSCHHAKFRSTEELEAHKAMCPYVRSLSVGTVTKSTMSLSSFDREQRNGYSRMDLVDSLDYLVEFTTVTKKNVKRFKRRQRQLAADQAAAVTTTTIPHVGQVALRCLFCRHDGDDDDDDDDDGLIGEEGSYIFPQSPAMLSRCMWRLCLTHLDRCENLPCPVKQRYQEFRQAIPMTDPTHDLYWRSVSKASFTTTTSSSTEEHGGGGIYWK